MKHVFTIHYIFLFLLVLLVGCRSKEGLREEVISLYEQGKQWEKAAQADSAAAYYLQSFELAKELKEGSLAGVIGNTLGDILNIQGLYNNALPVYKEAYLYNTKLKDKTAASHSLRGIGKNYVFNSIEDSIVYRIRLDSALFYFKQAKELIPEINNQNEFFSIYNNLSGLHINLKEYEKALEYNHKSIYRTKTGPEIYRDYSVRSKIYFYLQYYDSAIYYGKQAIKSEDLYTQYSAYYQLAHTFSQLSLPDSAIYSNKALIVRRKMEQQNREEEIMLFLQKNTQNQLIKERMIVFFCTVFVFILLSISIFILYRKHNRKKLLKKDYVIFSQREKLITEQKQTRNLFKKLEEITKISNYVELKEQRLNEEAKIVSKLIYLGNECAASFRKDPFYAKIMDDLNVVSSNEERECIFRKVNQYFMSYVQEVSKYIQLADEDYLVCGLTLVGFSTKHCAICREVREAAIRVQHKRIKENSKNFFYSEEFYDSIFGSKDG